MIGRAHPWGFAANGSAGGKNVFDLLRSGIDSTLPALGRPSVQDLSGEDIIVAAVFSRGLSK
jgi:pre-mycofactocin synthase